jgi:gliding-associated putative ABC transporter substrate-binding component GldG
MEEQLMRSNPHAKYRKEAWLKLLLTVGSIVIISFALSSLSIRLDLTEDNRYTLSEPSKQILGALKNDIYIQVYLDGDMPVPLKRLRRAVLELLEEFRIASDRKTDYSFINPSRGENDSQRNAMYESLITKGLSPTRLQAEDKEGGSSQKIIFPGLIINYNGIEVPLNFLRNNPALSPEQNILRASEALEYEIIQIISTLSADTVTRIAFIEGHGELPEIETADITYNLAKFFTVDRGAIGGRPGALDRYSAVVIAGPTREFSEADKFVIDQYIMNGGKVLWLLEEVYVNSDSLSLGETAALYRPLEIEDQLFRYGARVNPEVVQDLNCQFIRVKVIGSNGNQQLVPVPWVYYPLLAGSAIHPVTRNLNRVKGEFVNYIDTVGLDTAVRKEVLLATSEYTRTVNPPLLIRLSEAERLPDESEFTRKRLPVAVLLEGRFTSAFRNRMVEAFLEERVKVVDRSPETKMIVVADADIIRNGVRRTPAGESPLPLGQDRYTGEIYGNTDFILNCLNYLVDDKDLLQLRSRELKIRLLDKARIRHERIIWQVINTLGPLVLIIAAGFVFGYLRRRRYS